MTDEKMVEAGILVWARIGDKSPFPGEVQTSTETKTTVKLLRKTNESDEVYTISNDRIIEYSNGLQYAIVATPPTRRRIGEVLEDAVKSGKYGKQTNVLNSNSHRELVKGLKETVHDPKEVEDVTREIQDELSLARAHLRRCIKILTTKKLARDKALAVRYEVMKKHQSAKKAKNDAKLKFFVAECILNNYREKIARVGAELARARAQLSAAILQKRAANALVLQSSGACDTGGVRDRSARRRSGDCDRAVVDLGE